MRLLLFNLATDVDDPILGFTTRWICALAERMEFIHVITMRAGRLELPANVQAYSVGKEKGYSELRRVVKFYKTLYQILRKDHIDVCFSHMMPLFTAMAGPLLVWKQIPIVTWYAHPALTWTLRAAHHYSTHMVASLATAYPYKADKLIVIGQGIDTELFSPVRDALPNEPPMILCVGRLSPIKDHMTLLRAAWLLRQHTSKPFRVVVLGGPGSTCDSTYMEALQNETKKLELEDVVQFQSPAPMPQLPYWYRRCTVHVNMTPKGFGDKVALEAMACAKPSVVANEGFKETLGKFENRLLFRFGDAEDLAEKLRGILELSKTDREEIGDYLAQQINRCHSISHLATVIVQLLDKTRRSVSYQLPQHQ
jgi:glycosyltransferase involved in cell wall biosynthesis